MLGSAWLSFTRVEHILLDDAYITIVPHYVYKPSVFVILLPPFRTSTANAQQTAKVSSLNADSKLEAWVVGGSPVETFRCGLPQETSPARHVKHFVFGLLCESVEMPLNKSSMWVSSCNPGVRAQIALYPKRQEPIHATQKNLQNHALSPEQLLEFCAQCSLSEAKKGARFWGLYSQKVLFS